jgi:DNA-binding GntR family transcriptional regulator
MTELQIEGAGDLNGARPRRDSTVLSRRPFNEQILPFIRHDIITGRWKPNDRLSEPTLCREFGISRTPLRDAFKVLEAEGLISLVPHVGAVVTEPTVPDVGERMELLISLEQFAAYKVALLRPPAAVAEITGFHRAMIEAAQNAQAADYYRMNDDFHRAIVVAAGNKTLTDAHEKVMWHVYRARHLANEHEPLSQNAASHHQSIVDAIVSGDCAGAELAMREHLLEVSRVITGEPHGPIAAVQPTGTASQKRTLRSRPLSRFRSEAAVR